MSKIDYINEIINVPVIPLRGIVVFPEMLLHFEVGRKKSVAALKAAMKNNQSVFLVAQRDASVDEPSFDDLYKIGTLCKVKQMVKIPNSDNLRVVVEGEERGTLITFSQTKPYFAGEIDVLDCIPDAKCDEEAAYVRAIKGEFDKYISFVPKISNEIKARVISISDSGKLCDFVCSNTFLEYNEKQIVLEAISNIDRLKKLLSLLVKENSTLEIEAEIHEKVQEEIDKNQREYYMREEMKILSDALGENENPIEEADEYKKKIDALRCNQEIKDKLFKESVKLMKMPSGSHEGTVVRNYIDKCLEIPFGKYTKDSINLEKAEKFLTRTIIHLTRLKKELLNLLQCLNEILIFQVRLYVLQAHRVSEKHQ